MEKEIWLNLGSGSIDIEGYTNVDHKTGGEVYPIKLGTKERADVPGCDGTIRSDSIGRVRASHVLEHFPMKQVRDVVKEWVRVLKPGGVLEIAVPDFDYIYTEYGKHLRGEEFDDKIFGYLFGGQQDADDFHKTAMTADVLGAIMDEAGLENIEPWVSTAGDCAGLAVSLNRRGTKPLKPKVRIPRPSELPKIAAVMSMPRLAFSQNMFCALQELAPLGIEFTKVEGCWWHHCLSRAMQDVIDEGKSEYFLFLDYDSVFKREHFLSLLDLAKKYPDADAIAPMQVKRDDDCLLMGLLQPDGTPYPPDSKITRKHFEPEMVRASWAHFGLTLMKVSAIKKMVKPWFAEKPSPTGDWGEGRIDPDIGFWRAFIAQGNKLYLATKVPCGHLQLMCSWAGEDFSPIHQYACDFPTKGLPPGVLK